MKNKHTEWYKKKLLELQLQHRKIQYNTGAYKQQKINLKMETKNDR